MHRVYKLGKILNEVASHSNIKIDPRTSMLAIFLIRNKLFYPNYAIDIHNQR